jgi:uncharacterized membrane-anchored protein YjiN (DUF445 family)
MQAIATTLLGVMAVVFVVSARLRPVYPFLAWVEAFSEAALIGGLADWFAVVALFRYPAGLRLPHTAIVPNNKARIGRELGAFVEQNFLTPSNIASRLRELDLAGLLLRRFSDSQTCRALFGNVRGLMPRLFDAVDDAEVRAIARRVVSEEVGTVDLARAAASVLATITADGVHQRIFARVLPAIAGWLDGQRPEIKRRFAKRSILTPGFVGAYIVNRFVDGMIDLIGEIARTPGHPMRRELDAYLARLTTRLRDDPDMDVQAQRLKDAILRGPELERLIASAWNALETRARREPSDDSAVASWLSEMAAKIARGMLDDPAVVARLNERIGDAAESVLPHFQRQVSSLISEVVERWDAELMSEKIETELGPDLQFIRLNGSLVGGAAGVVLHAAVVVAGRG